MVFGLEFRIILLMASSVTEEIINLTILKQKIDHKFQAVVKDLFETTCCYDSKGNGKIIRI